MNHVGPLSSARLEEVRIVETCARASLLAYEDDAAVSASACAGAGFAVVARLKRGNNFVLAVDRGEVRVIAFRGTDQAADWRANLNVLLDRTPWGRVHRGFDHATNELWDDVSDLAAQARASGRAVHITGHSLGGAMAVLTAARVAGDAPSGDDRLVTFGQPAVGDSSFCARCEDTLAARYIRVVNHTDAIVETTPLFCEHAGRLWYFDIDGRLHHQVSFRRNLLDHVLAPARLGGFSQIEAHDMETYLRLLEAMNE